MIPLLEKLTPSDTITLTKAGDQVRMDYTLVGFENLKYKRRDMSLLFNPAGI